MQPTYLPWAGYFSLINTVDVFVFLDDVQYERRSWQSRNRILLQGKEHYLTVPVHKAPREEVLQNITINYDQDWQQSHLKILNHAYGKTAYGREIIDLVESVFCKKHKHLTALNIDLVNRFSDYLGIITPVVLASSFALSKKRSAHLAELCHATGSEAYHSPPGSRDYLEKDRFADETGIKLTFHDFTPKPYKQYGTPNFVSHLGIVDLLANCTQEWAAAYISMEQ